MPKRAQNGHSRSVTHGRSRSPLPLCEREIAWSQTRSVASSKLVMRVQESAARRCDLKQLFDYVGGPLLAWLRPEPGAEVCGGRLIAGVLQ